jgi:RimJ/RimL family protein N-acetyltransferase
MMLITPRLTLRELTHSDFDAVHAYASDPEVVRYMPWGPNTREDTLAFLVEAQLLGGRTPRKGYELGVERRADARLLGAIGLHVGDSDVRIAMLGYCLAREAWGWGYATEAAVEILRFAFEDLRLHRVWAGCDPDNRASVRVLEKLGMTLEGQLRQDTQMRGEWRDTLVFGILAQEWVAEHGG